MENDPHTTWVAFLLLGEHNNCTLSCETIKCPSMTCG